MDIFLLNHERVLWECLELAKLKISGILDLKTDQVEACLHMDDGVLKPSFQLKLDDAQPLEKDRFRKVTADVWLVFVKPELEKRLIGLRSRYRG